LDNKKDEPSNTCQICWEECPDCNWWNDEYLCLNCNEKLIKIYVKRYNSSKLKECRVCYHMKNDVILFDGVSACLFCHELVKQFN